MSGKTSSGKYHCRPWLVDLELSNACIFLQTWLRVMNVFVMPAHCHVSEIGWFIRVKVLSHIFAMGRSFRCFGSFSVWGVAMIALIALNCPICGHSLIVNLSWNRSPAPNGVFNVALRLSSNSVISALRNMEVLEPTPSSLWGGLTAMFKPIKLSTQSCRSTGEPK